MEDKEFLERLFEGKPIEFFHKLLEGVPIYEDLRRFHKQEIEHKLAYAIANTRLSLAVAAARVYQNKVQILIELKRIDEEKAQADRIAGAICLIHDCSLTVTQVAQALRLTDAEIEAVEVALKTSASTPKCN
jgi:hypothetical protein